MIFVMQAIVSTIHTCAKCGSADIRRNGHSRVHARYQCKACDYQARFVPATVAKAVQYVQVKALLVERNSLRSIARITGVARMTVAKRLKKSGRRPAALAPVTVGKGAAQEMGNPGTQ
jgi:transposase-like protein